jgi:hypothetical protein
MDDDLMAHQFNHAEQHSFIHFIDSSFHERSQKKKKRHQNGAFLLLINSLPTRRSESTLEEYKQNKTKQNKTK